MTRILALLMLAGLSGVGCSGGSPADAASSSEPAAERPQAAAPAEDKTRSSCDLITAEEASEIIGEPVVPKEDSTTGACYYGPATGTSLERQEFTLKVYWTGGQEEWELGQKSTEFAGKLLGGEDVVEGIAKSSKEAPLGDKSTYNPILGGYVLKGDVLLQFDNLMRVKDAQSKWEQLAKKALSRL